MYINMYIYRKRLLSLIRTCVKHFFGLLAKLSVPRAQLIHPASRPSLLVCASGALGVRDFRGPYMLGPFVLLLF